MHVHAQLNVCDYSAKLYASMKLMIVGQANIGKTTLLAELRKEGRALNPFKTFSDRVNPTNVVNQRRNGMFDSSAEKVFLLLYIYRLPIIVKCMVVTLVLTILDEAVHITL